MTEKIRNTFNEIKGNRQRSAMSEKEKLENDICVIEYLKKLLDSGSMTDFKDIGFSMWNLSDTYALRRDSEHLYENHLAFEVHIRAFDVSYLWWLVNDATQKFTLALGGHSKWWYSLYRSACDNNKPESYFHAYHCHRAAFSCHPAIAEDTERVLFAKRRFEDFIDAMYDTCDISECDFFRIMYESASARNAAVGTIVGAYMSPDLSVLPNLCERFYSDLSLTETDSQYAFGEWESFVTPYSPRQRAAVAIPAAINALIYGGNKKSAREIYEIAREHGLAQNYYIEKRLY